MMMKKELSLDFLPMMKKGNNSIIKLNENEIINTTEAFLSMTTTEEETGNTENLESEFYLGLFIILIFVTIPPSLTVIFHIIM